jgi:hypothetical protein
MTESSALSQLPALLLLQEGSTPLHAAAMEGHADVVAALLQAHANLEAATQVMPAGPLLFYLNEFSQMRPPSSTWCPQQGVGISRTPGPKHIMHEHNPASCCSIGVPQAARLHCCDTAQGRIAQVRPHEGSNNVEYARVSIRLQLRGVTVQRHFVCQHVCSGFVGPYPQSEPSTVPWQQFFLPEEFDTATSRPSYGLIIDCDHSQSHASLNHAPTTTMTCGSLSTVKYPMQHTVLAML